MRVAVIEWAEARRACITEVGMPGNYERLANAEAVLYAIGIAEIKAAE
jgi:hypothetical protein